MLIHSERNINEQNHEKPVERKSAMQTGGSSFGGFSTKWEYESYRQKQEENNAGVRRTTLALVLGLIFGISILVAVLIVTVTKTSGCNRKENEVVNTAATVQQDVSETELAGTYGSVNAVDQGFGEVFADESEDGEGFRFGVMGSNVDKETAKRYRLPIGILVTEVIAGFPGELMGLQKNDIILSVDGARVYGMVDLLRSLSGYTGNEGIVVDVYRGDGETILHYTPNFD